MEFTVDLTHLEPAVRNAIARKVRHEDRARFDLGVLEQRRLKQLHDQVAVAGFNNDIGRQSMVISSDQYTRFMQVYGQKCWSDPAFAKWVLKQDQHADFRVRDVGTKVQSGFTGKGDTRR